MVRRYLASVSRLVATAAIPDSDQVRGGGEEAAGLTAVWKDLFRKALLEAWEHHVMWAPSLFVEDEEVLRALSEVAASTKQFAFEGARVLGGEKMRLMDDELREVERLVREIHARLDRLQDDT